MKGLILFFILICMIDWEGFCEETSALNHTFNKGPAREFAYEKISFNTLKEPNTFNRDQLLIASISIKAVGFAVMTVANNREKKCLFNPELRNKYAIDNTTLHQTGFFIFAVSIPLDGIYLFKRNGK